MKKTYMKPIIIIENFSLAQSIANGCKVDDSRHFGDPNMWSKTTCGWIAPEFGDIIFIKDGICNNIVDPNVEINGVCYNAPTAGTVVFGS